MTEKILELNREKTIFWILSAILLLSVGFYMYSINATIRNIVLRERLEAESSQISLNVSNQEFKYITMHNSITLSLAYAHGFKDVSEKKFISQNHTDLVSFLPR